MGRDEPQLTAQTLDVLGTFASHLQASGAEIGRMTKLKSGTLYPILFRLEKAGWLESNWEDGDPTVLGRPRRRLYRITGLGVKKGQEAYSKFTPLRELAWEG
jgi:PadR family transcriptional regulator, regulatory protein PadR